MEQDALNIGFKGATAGRFVCSSFEVEPMLEGEKRLIRKIVTCNLADH